MKKQLSYIIKVIFPFLLAGAILWWMYRKFQWSEIMEASRQMSWTWMLLSMPFGILAQVFRALRWRQVLAPMGEKPRLGTCINAVFLSYASSLVVPRVGEVLRCTVLTRYEGTDFSRGIGTVVSERVVDMLIVLLLSFFTMMVQIPVFLRFFQRTGVSLESFLAGFSPAGYLVTGLCLLVLLAGLWLLAYKLHLMSRTRAIMARLTEGLLSVTRIHNVALFLFYSIGIWVSYLLHFYLTFYCFSYTAGLGIWAALVAFVVGSFAVLVPTPNGAGPWHFAVKTVLVLYGVNQVSAILFVFLVHTLQTLLVVLLGLYAIAALALTSRRQNSLKTEK